MTYQASAAADPAFHYPPDLLNLLVEAIPRLCPSKDDVLLFFRGAGVRASVTASFTQQLRIDRGAVKKHEMVRTILSQLNANGDGALRERREILKRVTEWEDFSTCWPNDRLEAIGLVGQVQRVINVRDSFTRMSQERETERRERIAEQRRKHAQAEDRGRRLDDIRRDLSALFVEPDAQTRGKVLEGVLNRLFALDGVLVRESSFSKDGMRRESSSRSTGS